MNETISGLGALGFWLFLAVAVVAIAWVIVRKAQIRKEMLIRIAESGQNLDRDLIEKVLSATPPKKDKPYDPIRHGNEGAGFWFLIGFITVFVGIIWEGGISYPIIGLGVFAIIFANWVWFSIGKAARRYEKKNPENIDEAP
jgi:hypothetical protein